MPATVDGVASANGTSNYTCNVPARTSDGTSPNGDLLIGVVASDWNTLANNTLPLASWTALTTSDYDGGSNQMHIGLFARVASSEPANYTVTIGGGADSVAAIVRVKDWDQAAGIATAVKQIAPAVIAAGTGAMAAPSIVPAGSDDLLMTFYSVDGANGGGTLSWTPPSGMTEVVDRQSTTWTSLEVASLQPAANPSGTKTAVTSPTNHGKGAACTIAIKSAAGGGSASGTIAATMGGMTASMSGSAKASGSLNGALGPITASMPGSAKDSGTIAGALPGIAASITTAAKASGSVASVLPGLAAAFDGQGLVVGTVDAQLPAISSVMSGGPAPEGTTAMVLPSLVAEIAGELSSTSLLDGQLPAIGSSIDAEASTSSVVSIALPAIGASLDADSVVIADATLLLPAIGSVISGDVSDDGDLVLVIPSMTADLAGTSETPMNAMDIILPGFVMSVTGEVLTDGDVDASLPGMTADMDVEVIDDGEVVVGLPPITALFAADAKAQSVVASVLPSITALLDGQTSGGGGSLAIILPRLTATIFGSVDDNGGVEPYQPVEDPTSSVRPNGWTATARTKATVKVRPNQAEAKTHD